MICVLLPEESGIKPATVQINVSKTHARKIELTPGCPSPDEGDVRRHAKPGQRPSRSAGLSSTRHPSTTIARASTRSTPPASPVRSARRSSSARDRYSSTRAASTARRNPGSVTVSTEGSPTMGRAGDPLRCCLGGRDLLSHSGLRGPALNHAFSGLPVLGNNRSADGEGNEHTAIRCTRRPGQHEFRGSAS